MSDPAPNAHLVQLRTRVDTHFDAAVSRSPANFACRPGCAQCCERISVFEVEAEPIREALAQIERADPELRARIREQGRREDTRCALLVDGLCSVYEQRPLICRSHGLPVAVTVAVDGGVGGEPGSTTLEVDHCPLNFTDAPPPRESVLVLDALNRPLAVLTELTAPGRPRVALAQLAAQ